jgi:hypothetical protein
MKINLIASSILLTTCILLAGCGSLGLPDLSRVDNVPPEVKAEPRLVETAPPLTGNETWPRLGDVPFKPEDFSPKPVYDHYMNELEYDRAVGDDAKDKLEQQSPVPDAAAPVTEVTSHPLPKE